MPYLVEHERTVLPSAVGDEKALAASVVRPLRDNRLAVTLAENAHRESRKYEWGEVRQQWLSWYRGLPDLFLAATAMESQSARDIL
jgi:hypothetical protein